MKQTILEKASGNLGTSIATTLLAASGGTYFAPLLPVLANSLANQRYQNRIEDALEDLNKRFNEIEELVINMTDNQFKLVGEIVSSILHTTSDDKINLLKDAAINGITIQNIKDHETTVLARILRDISIVEYDFLKKLQKYREIVVYIPPKPEHSLRERVVQFKTNSDEEQLLNSLVSLGVLTRGASGYGGVINYSSTDIGSKLVDICKLNKYV